ncbi:MAG: TolC family protein [Nitrospirae bacterium]|nr:TolC family protein [Nitrospirota bacterium]
MLKNCQKIFRYIFLFGVMLVFIAPSGSFAETEEVLTRETLTAMVLQSNPELLSARKKLDRAKSEITRVSVLLNPDLEVWTETDALTAREGEGSLSFGLSQEIVTGGKRNYQKRIAEGELEKTGFEITDLERWVTAEAGLLFGQLLFLQERFLLQEEAIRRAEAWVDLTLGRFRGGYVPEFDVNLARIEYQETLREEESLKKEALGVQMRINTLLGRSPEIPLTASGSFSVSAAYKDAASLNDESYRSRPDLKGAEAAVDQARLRVALANALRTPDVRVSLGYTYDVGVFDVNDRTVRDRDHLFGGTVSVPLMVFDKKKGEIQEAVAEEGRTRLEYEALRTGIRGEVSMAAQELARAVREAEIVKENILPLATENLDLTEKAYRLGKAGVLDVMEARRRYLQTRLSFLEAEYQVDRATTELEKVIGKKLER